ncbi:MAG: hypothetical protein RIG61_05020 [Deltaproteobacteria bacterium]
MRYFACIAVITFLLLPVLVNAVYADPVKDKGGHDMSPVTGSQELEKMKTLEGSWQGTTVMDGKEVPISVVYETSSNGSVVVETLSPGTPHEMVSVYYDVDGKLNMTHYCAVNNQPHFTLKESTGDRIDLDFAGGTNLNADKDGHMHAVSFNFKDTDNMVQEWTYYESGEEKQVSAFTLTRTE